MRAVRPLLLCAALACLSPVRAADLDEGKLNLIPERMKAFIDRGQISGAVTVVGRSNGTSRTDAFGSRDLAKQQPMKADTLFRIASMTKPITAVGVMILVEQGKLKLDDPVEKYLPEFRGQMMVASRDKDSVTLKKPPRPITPRDLLTHTSGLAPYEPGLAGIYAKRDRTLAESVLAVSQKPLDFEPGSKWSYCNSGIDTLGRLIEVLSGEPYEQFLKRKIFEPLGMKDTVFYPEPGQATGIAQLHGVKDGKLVVSPDNLIGPGVGAKHPIPAGGLFSTGPDLAKFYRMMLNKGKSADAQILSEESVREMTKVHTRDMIAGFTPGMGFGLGWAVVKKPEGVTAMLSPGSYGHGGAFGTQAWLDPEKDLFMVLLIQRVGLSGGDGSELRRTLQTLAVDALKK